jgi:hypothetical protein
LNTFLKMVGVVALVVIAMICIFVGWIYLNKTQYEKTAVPYIQKVIPEMSKWDPSIAKQYFSPEVLKNQNDETLNKLMKFLSKMGKLKSFEHPEFVSVTTSATTSSGKMKFIAYTVICHYENGDATLSISLKQVDQGFEIYSYHLNSMALAE